MLIMKIFLVMGFGALSIIRPSMQLFVICKCIFSRKKFFLQIPHSCLCFSCTIRTCLPSGLGPLNVLLQRSHLETMSGSNECDKLEKYVIISLILMCNTVTIPYSYLIHYLIYIFLRRTKNHHKYLTVCE